MNRYKKMIVLCVALLSSGVTLAQNSGAVNDCADHSVSYDDNLNLTRQEKIDLMDQALLNSLNKYERCQNHRDQASSQGAEDAANNAGTTSTASAEMSGTTAVSKDESSTQMNKNVTEEKGPNKQSRSKKVLGSGKVPDDIPPADNDSVLEEQIRQAAIHEPDPLIQKRLWNEYRKYKGLPVLDKH